MSELYYSDKSRVNNSSIGYFLRSPKEYHTRMTEDVGDHTTSAMAFGTAMHAYILQPDEFKKTYKVKDCETPSLKQQKEFCEHFINETGKPREKALKAYLKSYSKGNKSDAALQKESLALLMKYKTYIQQQSKSEKQYLSWYQFNKIKTLAALTKHHVFADQLIQEIGECEFHINWKHCDVDCKSLIDKVILRHDSKEIILVDLKTTASISEFKDSIEKYDYRRQMMFYKLAIDYYLENELKLNPNDYSFKCYLIALQTNDSTPLVEVIELTLEQLLERKEVIEDTLSRIYWHTENNAWEHSKEYYEGQDVIRYEF